MPGNPTICRWLIKLGKKYGLSSFFIPKKDIYMIHFKGKALQGFNSEVFWQIPPLAREKELVGILKLGLRLNIEEKNRDNLFTKRRLGKLIFEA